ncbi:MAG TPA: putative Ig domain-containing protein, partial [Candidatus Saccharimonadales bacterium]|nr:putative Ig domain-containing protein [Candidatus Saccharimonadales bacterium]
MLTSLRSAASSVTKQILGISALIAILFIAGCASGGGSASLAVTTTSGQLATVVISSAYPQTTLTAANGTAPYTWTVSGGALPTGMALSSAGVLSGTPTAFGTFSFTVTVTDSATPTPHTATASLNVLVNPAITSVALNPTTVTGGTASTATVTLTGAATAAASVTLASNNAAASVPATVTVAAGQTTATFQVTTTAVSASATPTITATYGVAKTATLTVNPPTVTSVVVAPTTVIGGTTSTGTVTLSGPAATGGDSVTLTSDNLSAAQVGASVSVPAGQSTAQFNVTTTAVVSSATAHIQGSFNSTSQSATLTVLPAVTIHAPTFPTGVATLSYASPAFTASGGSGSGYTYAISSGSIAPLVINSSTGIISGTPATATTLQFSVKVTDSLGFTATASGLSITINAAISVGLAPASPVTLDQGKTQLITATVNNDLNAAGVNWSITSGAGTLTGSTTTTVTYNAPGSVGAASTATVKATSITDPSKSATFTINLVPQPSITTTTLAAGNVNGAYTSAVTMTGGVAPYTWSFTALPTGLGLSASTTSTVNVTGTPTVAGANQTATIKVTDAQGLSATSSGLTI